MNKSSRRILFIQCKIKYFIRRIIRKIKRKFHLKTNYSDIRFGKPFIDINSAQAKIYDLIMSGKPFMAARMGGVEGAAALEAIQVQNGWKKNIKPIAAERAQINAGFFPPTTEKLFSFADIMQDSLKQVDILGSMSTNDEEFLIRTNVPDSAVLTNLANLEPYYCDTPWTKALKGKKVLVIYPLEDSIKNQYKKRELLYESPDILPEFDLKVLKSVQSIAGTKTEFADWFEALNYMYEEAMKIDFDVAVIGCGAYGFPLAAMLKKAGKQAIHLGGATQILFGIKGDRWEHIPDVKKLFNEHWIYPAANEVPENARKVEDSCYWKREDDVKVAQINCACEFGSTGRITVEISKQLDAKNIENYIYYSGNKKSSFKNGVLVNSKFDIRIHQILSRIFGDQGWHSYFTTRRLVRNLKKFSPNIIHLHNLHGYYLHMGVLFSYLSKSGAKVIWTLHDCWPFTGHCSFFVEANCDRWTKQCFSCSQKKTYPYSWFFDRSKTLFKRKQKLYDSVPDMVITTVSNWLANTTLASKLLSKHRVQVIHNGVDTEVFKPFPPVTEINGISVCDKKIILGVANSWSDRKGLLDFKKLAERLTDDYVIVLVGVRKEQLSDMPGNIICVERTDSTEALAQLYSSALVYYNASVEETFGLTTIEAMACGTPVIAYDVTACAEPVSEDTGFVLSPNDIDGALAAIKEVSEKGKTHYAEACRNHAIEKYRADKIYAQYVDLYFNELGKN